MTRTRSTALSLIILWMFAGCSAIGGSPAVPADASHSDVPGQRQPLRITSHSGIGDRAESARDTIIGLPDAGSTMASGERCDAAIPLVSGVSQTRLHTEGGGVPSTQCRVSANGAQRFFTFLLPVGQRATVTVSPAIGQHAVVRILTACDASECLTDAESDSPGASVTLIVDSPGDVDRTKIVSVSSSSAGVDVEFGISLLLAPIGPPPVANAVQIATGESHSCALLGDRTVRCWGANDLGQLGDGTDTSRATPRPVTGLTDVLRVAAAGSRTCALRSDGTVWCWGARTPTEPGASDLCVLGSSDPLPCNRTPRQIDGIGGATSLVMNRFATCAIRTDETVWCWGQNPAGLFGDTVPFDHFTPTPIAGLDHVAQLAMSERHACARISDGTLRCWGYDDLGQLGGAAPADSRCVSQGPTIPCSSTPMAVPGMTAVAFVATGEQHTCVAKTDGSVWCWGWSASGILGFDDRSGELCNPRGRTFTTPCRRVPVQVPGLAGIVELSAAGSTTCARSGDGVSSCWGDNAHAQIGNGTTTTALSPTRTPLPAAAVDMAVAPLHACAVVNGGAVYCWGSNLWGELGTQSTALCRGTEPCRLVPTLVPGLDDVRDIAMGLLHQCALRGDRTVWCWGGQRNGLDLGTGGAPTLSPSPVLGLTDVAEVAAGGEHTCARLLDGTVRCWGVNGSGEVGVVTIPPADGGTPIESTPRSVSGLTHVVQLALGISHSCARRDDGTVWCWGDGPALGDGVGTSRSTPAPVPTLSNVIDIQARRLHTCAILADHTVRCWGFNGGGQLGDGTTTDRLVPVTVLQGGSPLVAEEIEPGGFHTCARTAAGIVLCWGRGWNGALGDGSGADHLEPIEVVGARGAVELAGSYLHTCARFADGSARCWGLNSTGQLGNGGTGDAYTPVDVLALDDATRMATDVFRTCAIHRDRTVSCWGHNEGGGAGDDPQRWCNGLPCLRTPTLVSF